MRIVIQRVTQANVRVKDQDIGQINSGLVLLVGFSPTDSIQTVQQMADKISHLRIFADKSDKMNLDIKQVGGEVLLIPQFTLYGDLSGRRPGWQQAASPELAKELYQELIEAFRTHELKVQTGQFGAHMQVELINDGPVTFYLEN